MSVGDPYHGEFRRTLEPIEMNNGKRMLIDHPDNFLEHLQVTQSVDTGQESTLGR